MPKRAKRPSVKKGSKKPSFKVAKATSRGYGVAKGPSLSSSRSAAQHAFNSAVASKSKTVLHVVPHDGKWAVRPQKSKAVRVFASQDAAIKAARRVASPENGTVVIHGRSGQFRDTRSY